MIPINESTENMVGEEGLKQSLDYYLWMVNFLLLFLKVPVIKI